MKIRHGKLCSLASSKHWHIWLREYDAKLYGEFIRQMRESSGCTENGAIVSHIIDKIIASGGEAVLFDFLSKYHPHVVEIKGNNILHEYFTTGLLTYPHRKIIKSNSIKADVESFVSDKIRYDYIIDGDTAYIEYLTSSDAAIVDNIPESNWLIKKYKNNKPLK